MDRKAVLLRLEGETHDAVRKAAAAAGLSLNEWVCQAVESQLAGSAPRSALRRQVLDEVADVVARLANGFILVPREEVSADQWTQIMRPESR